MGGAVVAVAGQRPGATLLLAVALALALGVGVATVRDRDLPGGTSLGVVMVLVAAWCASYAGQLVAADAVVRWRFSRVTFVAVAYVPVAWLAFAIDYTGRGPRLTPRVAGAMLVVPTITAVLAVAGHPSLLTLASTGGDGSPALARGQWFWIHTAYSSLLLVVGTALFAVLYVVRDERSTRAAVALGAAAVPWLANAIHLSGLFGLPLDPTPVAFVVTGTVFAVAIAEWDLLDVFPVAREVARDAIIETMDDGVVVLSDTGRVLDLNPAAEVVLPGIGIGDSLGSVEAIDDADDLPVEVELGHDGEHRRYELRGSSFDQFGGLVSGRLVTVRDVTRDRRHQQRLAVLNRILRHDLRNDLNTIQGHADLLETDPNAAESPAIIRAKADRLVDLATKVREAERMLGRGESVRSEHDVTRLVRDRVDSARRERPFADFTVDVPSTPVVVRSSDLLGVAVDNLVENAIVHTDSLTPHVSVTVRRSDGPDPSVELAVADTGPGIPGHEQQVLTEGEETPLKHGSGIGLWLVNWIVSESMGTVSFDENEPTGSVVTLRLPAGESADEPAASAGSEPAP
jgi:signal transduction histidine kinase